MQCSVRYFTSASCIFTLRLSDEFYAKCPQPETKKVERNEGNERQAILPGGEWGEGGLQIIYGIAHAQKAGYLKPTLTLLCLLPLSGTKCFPFQACSTSGYKLCTLWCVLSFL